MNFNFIGNLVNTQLTSFDIYFLESILLNRLAKEIKKYPYGIHASNLSIITYEFQLIQEDGRLLEDAYRLRQRENYTLNMNASISGDFFSAWSDFKLHYFITKSFSSLLPILIENLRSHERFQGLDFINYNIAPSKKTESNTVTTNEAEWTSAIIVSLICAFFLMIALLCFGLKYRYTKEKNILSETKSLSSESDIEKGSLFKDESKPDESKNKPNSLESHTAKKRVRRSSLPASGTVINKKCVKDSNTPEARRKAPRRSSLPARTAPKTTLEISSLEDFSTDYDENITKRNLMRRTNSTPAFVDEEIKEINTDETGSLSNLKEMNTFETRRKAVRRLSLPAYPVPDKIDTHFTQTEENLVNDDIGAGALKNSPTDDNVNETRAKAIRAASLPTKAIRALSLPAYPVLGTFDDDENYSADDIRSTMSHSISTVVSERKEKVDDAGSLTNHPINTNINETKAKLRRSSSLSDQFEEENEDVTGSLNSANMNTNEIKGKLLRRSSSLPDLLEEENVDDIGPSTNHSAFMNTNETKGKLLRKSSSLPDLLEEEIIGDTGSFKNHSINNKSVNERKKNVPSNIVVSPQSNEMCSLTNEMKTRKVARRKSLPSHYKKDNSTQPAKQYAKKNDISQTRRRVARRSSLPGQSNSETSTSLKKQHVTGVNVKDTRRKVVRRSSLPGQSNFEKSSLRKKPVTDVDVKHTRRRVARRSSLQERSVVATSPQVNIHARVSEKEKKRNISKEERRRVEISRKKNEDDEAR